MADLRLPLFNMCGDELVAAGYRISDVVSAYEELYAVFGRDWVDQQVTRKESIEQRGGTFFVTHPLLSGMGTGDVPAVAQALELAMILRQFRDDPSLPLLVAQMRSWEQFADAYYALRVAFRFNRIGFGVQLEPATVAGRADFLATRAGIIIGGECKNTRSRLSLARTEADTIRTLVDQAPPPEGSVLELTITARLTPAVEKSVLELLRKLGRRDASGCRRQSRFATATIRPPSADERDILFSAREGGNRTGYSNFVRDQWKSGWCVVIGEKVKCHDPDDPGTYDMRSVRPIWLAKIRMPEESPPPAASVHDEIDRSVSAKLRHIREHPRDWTSAPSILY